MTAHVGRDTLIEFAIAAEDATEASLTYITLGMTRDRTLEDAWEVVDVTADMSPDFTKQSLVTFKQVSATINGVSYDDAIHNQLTLKAHIANPPSTTGYQPKVWLRFTYPSHTRSGPFIATKLSEAEPYADGATWDMSFESNGPISFTIT